jgi:hypothetical protein
VQYFVVIEHAPSEDKCNEVKDSFYEKTGSVFNQFPKYNMRILFADFNAKIGKESNFKPTNGNKSLYEIANDKGVRGVNVATCRDHFAKRAIFPHRDIFQSCKQFCGSGKPRAQGFIDRVSNTIIQNNRIKSKCLGYWESKYH